MRKKKDDILRDEQSLYAVLEFAKNVYNGNIIPNVYTPDLVNARMKDLNLNPLSATEANIEKALRDPKNSEIELKELLAKEHQAFADWYVANCFDIEMNPIGCRDWVLQRSAWIAR